MDVHRLSLDITTTLIIINDHGSGKTRGACEEERKKERRTMNYQCTPHPARNAPLIITMFSPVNAYIQFQHIAILREVPGTLYVRVPIEDIHPSRFYISPIRIVGACDPVNKPQTSSVLLRESYYHSYHSVASTGHRSSTHLPRKVHFALDESQSEVTTQKQDNTSTSLEYSWGRRAHSVSNVKKDHLPGPRRGNASRGACDRIIYNRKQIRATCFVQSDTEVLHHGDRTFFSSSGSALGVRIAMVVSHVELHTSKPP